MIKDTKSFHFFNNYLNIDVDSAISKQEGIAEKGFRLVFNSGNDGRQEVYHLHMHLLGGRKMNLSRRKWSRKNFLFSLLYPTNFYFFLNRFKLFIPCYQNCLFRFCQSCSKCICIRHFMKSFKARRRKS